jgi:hypothetical protein
MGLRVVNNLVDLVQVSLIQGGFVELKNGVNTIQAFEKLNMDPEINVVEIDENQLIIEEAKQALMN